MRKAVPPHAVVELICQQPQTNKASRDPLILLILHDRSLSQTLFWRAKHASLVKQAGLPVVNLRPCIPCKPAPKQA